MKKIITAFALIAAFNAGAESESGGVQQGVKDTVSGIVSFGKDVLSSTKEGIDEGRKSGESLDGAIIVSDKSALQEHLEVSVLRAEEVGKHEYQVTLVLRNNGDRAVRLTNLAERSSLQLMDKDGFVSYTSVPYADMTVPEKAAVRERILFVQQEEAPTRLRLYGMEFPIQPSP